MPFTVSKNTDPELPSDFWQQHGSQMSAGSAHVVAQSQGDLAGQGDQGQIPFELQAVAYFSALGLPKDLWALPLCL